MEANNNCTRKATLRKTRRRKRQPRQQHPRVRSRKKCPTCDEEYSHSSYYTHKCGRINDQEDEVFSLQFPTTSTSSSSDSEFHISCSDGEAPYHEATVAESEPQLDEFMQQSIADLQPTGTFIRACSVFAAIRSYIAS